MSDEQQPDIPVVDSKDRFIRWASREEVHEKRLIHRSVNALVFDVKDRLLLQLQHPDKATQPGCWDLSCSGHVERIDHGDQESGLLASGISVVRELDEELGLSEEPHYVCPVPPIDEVAYEFMQLYVLRSVGPFTLQANEVASVRWAYLEDILSLKPLTRQLRG